MFIRMWQDRGSTFKCSKISLWIPKVEKNMFSRNSLFLGCWTVWKSILFIFGISCGLCIWWFPVGDKETDFWLIKCDTMHFYQTHAWSNYLYYTMKFKIKCAMCVCMHGYVLHVCVEVCMCVGVLMHEANIGSVPLSFSILCLE